MTRLAHSSYVPLGWIGAVETMAEARTEDGLTPHRQQYHLENYTVDFHDQQSKTLVVTFEYAGKPDYRPNMDRLGWGVDWLTRQGHSVLAVKPLRTDWYRKKDLHHFLTGLRAGGFFDRFENVVFYGASMGGYAALAFSSLAPGCTVLALSPQVTLNPEMTAWDARFREGKQEDWGGQFVSGSDCSHAGRVFVVYDPMNKPDRIHAESVVGDNVVHLKFPAGGHLVASQLSQLRLLGAVFRSALDGSLSTLSFAKIARHRKSLISYWVILAKHARSYKVAAACMDRARRIRQDEFSVAFYDTYLAHKWADWPAAIDLARAALRRKPRDAYLHTVLAESLREVGSLTEAEQACNAGLALFPTNARLQRALSSLRQAA